MRSLFPALLLLCTLPLFTGCGGSTPSTITGPPVVSVASTTTTLAATPNPAAAGAAVTLTATVASTGGTPTGTVTFFDGATSLGTGTLASGTATLSISTFAAGSTHSLTATYAATTLFSASTSAAVSETIGAASLTASASVLTATPNPATAGSPVTLTATVSSASGTPAGTVNFLDGTTPVGSATLSTTGVATFTVPSFTAGTTHSLTATFTGSATYAPSTSAPVSLVVSGSSMTATKATLTATPNPVAPSSPVTLTASITATTGTAMPTGTITFLDGNTNLGTGTLTNGTATLVIPSFLANTTHTLTATYANNATFSGSTSNAVTLTVTNAAAPAAITAHGSFSFTTPNQTIMGFGGAQAFYQSFLDSHPFTAEINTALFDPIQGLGLSFIRLQNTYYNFTGSNATTFDPDNSKLVAGANTAHGSPVSVEMSAWTPSAALKSNNNVNGCTGTTNGNCSTGIGTIIQTNGAYNYAGYGKFWSDSLAAYAAQGVTPNYISIQNEPDFAAPYVGMRLGANEASGYASYGLAFDAVYKAINSGALATVPKMLAPETFSVPNVQSFLTQVPPAEMAGIAHHLYNVGSGGDANGSGGYTTGGNPDSNLAPMAALNTAYPNTLKFETEYYQAPGFYNAMDIENALTTANDNVYFFWQLTWPSTQQNGISVDQAGLLYTDNIYNAQSTWAYPHGWTYNDAYYTMKHFSYLIRPGYVRYNATVDNTTDERISVYQAPDQSKTVIVILNVSTTVTDGIALDLSSYPYTSSTVYRSTFSTPLTTPGAERFSNLGPYAASGINLPPQSAVTIVLTK